jgi:hypothetical protein
MARYFAYELVDPRNNKPFYVGIGDRERVKGGYRPDDHIQETRSWLANPSTLAKYNIAKLEIIAELLEIQTTPIVNEIHEDDNLDNVSLFEIAKISGYGRKINGGLLVNQNDGGGGLPFPKGHHPWNKGRSYTYEEIMGIKKAEETKKKKSVSAKLSRCTPPSAVGVKRSQSWKDAHSKYWKDRPKTLEQRKKISETNKAKGIRPPSTGGCKQTPESNEKRRIALLAYWAKKRAK